MIPTTTRVVVLQGRPEPGGDPSPDLFAVEERPIPQLEPGQLLVRNVAMSVDPSMRGRLDLGEKQYTTNFQVGEPLDGSAIGQVISAAPGTRVAEGALVRHRAGWREHAVIEASAATVIDGDAAPVGAWLGILGQTGFTAWVGLKRIGELAVGTACSSLLPPGPSARPQVVSPGFSGPRGWSAAPAAPRRWPSSCRTSATTTPWTTGPSLHGRPCPAWRQTGSTSTSTTSVARTSSPPSTTCGSVAVSPCAA